MRLGEHLIGTLLRPRATFEALGHEKSARAGASAIAVLGIPWGILCVLLWSAEVEPAFVLVPIPGDLYYLTQALLTLPILTGLWWIFGEIAHRLCRAANGTGEEAGVRAALGFAYAAPMLVHVATEIVAFALGGTDALRVVAPFSLPAASLLAWALSALALRVTHRVSVPVALGASFVGLFVQAVAGALVLR
jgi:hypothetical protein